MERESMEFDVVIVGAGPAGLSAAIKLKQLANAANHEISICVVEKGSEVGAHSLSGAVFEPSALNELIPDWKSKGAPLHTAVINDDVYVFHNATSSIKVPNIFVPKTMHNEGNYLISLGSLVRWLGEQAEALGIDIYPGFPAASIVYADNGAVKGVVTGDMGISKEGEHKSSFAPGMELLAKYTVFAEGCRGHLGRRLIEKYRLNKDKDPQHYGLGIKELWEIPAAQHQQGLVVHTAGWPLNETDSAGGGFLYHLENNIVALGLIADLSYSNPHMSPFDEFQRFKLHPKIKQYITGGKRVSYGARAITKGGLQSQPKMHFPGGLLIGDDAGTMNFAKIKGNHTAMKSGMVAAESIFKALQANRANDDIKEFADAYKQSSAYKELWAQRNFGPAQHKWGNIIGSAYAFIDINIFNGYLPWTLRDPKADHEQLKLAQDCKKITYPKPDGVFVFDKLSSVFLSNTFHEEDQPGHLTLKDERIPIQYNLKHFDAPEQRYCPAGVYEIVEEGDQPRLQINAQNCVHCKTCDIKDPHQNIVWVTPEGGGGPNYSQM
ncbi:MAG: electron transfer flavoprotein-ubiquinone oxidoreductase [Gammaproteobacteria bacterium]|nr:electron transfer flavoprotein-ubiquinone oxidoreductase [Gammaproteobacteria bacterium]